MDDRSRLLFTYTLNVLCPRHWLSTGDSQIISSRPSVFVKLPIKFFTPIFKDYTFSPTESDLSRNAELVDPLSADVIRLLFTVQDILFFCKK